MNRKTFFQSLAGAIGLGFLFKSSATEPVEDDILPYRDLKPMPLPVEYQEIGGQDLVPPLTFQDRVNACNSIIEPLYDGTDGHVSEAAIHLEELDLAREIKAKGWELHVVQRAFILELFAWKVELVKKDLVPSGQLRTCTPQFTADLQEIPNALWKGLRMIKGIIDTGLPIKESVPFGTTPQRAQLQRWS